MVLPYKQFSTIIVTHAVFFSVMWFNFFPPKGGVSSTLSPQAIIAGTVQDFKKQCRVPFGSYAQVHTEPSPSNNVMTSRTVGGMA
jgi:hypothetical protein